MTQLCDQILSRFDSTERKLHDFENELDSETNFLQNIMDTCKYYTDSEFNDNVKISEVFSLVHFNCRSIYSNFDQINDYLKTLKSKFKAIALTESWLTEDKGVDFQIEGYQFFFRQ